MNQEEIKRFTFKQILSYQKKESFLTPISQILPNKNYVFNIIKEEKNQTLRDIWCGIGWGEEITNQIGFEFGKVLNVFIPKRNFEKVENDYNGIKMNVRLYHWYEVPFIICSMYAYFDIFNFIPLHWSYNFYQETNIGYIVYNLLRSNITLNTNQRIKLEALSHDRNELYYLEEIIYQKCPLLINKNKPLKDYYSINAKYGLAIELIILHYLNQK